jgi:hypothetical protein
MKKINLATELKLRLVKLINEKRNFFNIPDGLTVEELLCDDDTFSDWLSIHWNIIKNSDMLIVRDFMVWSYMLNTEASLSFQPEYYFDETK